MFKLQLQTII